jgi:hypothetical protein
MEIVVRNVNALFAEMFWKLKVCGIKSDSRNGEVVRFPEPVLTRVRYPVERVLFHQERDANPVFHLMEAIWMIAGRNDVGFLQQFNSRIERYSDDGYTFNSAYGHRWSTHFGLDQVIEVIKLLEKDPDTRQAVIELWDPADLTKKTKDKACNTQVMFEIVNRHLNMTVINRSNDMWYGYAGANIVHFTFLQEFVASALDISVGEYRTFSNNLHLYLNMYDAKEYLKCPPYADFFDLYNNQCVRPLPIMLNTNYEGFIQDCKRFCDDPFKDNDKYAHLFFSKVAHPVAMVIRTRKLDAGTGQGWAEKIYAQDWRRAVMDWIHRRESKKQSVANS